jgi:uncharacterized Tic20 family protein
LNSGEVHVQDKSEVTPDERTWAMLAHLSALLGFLIPFGNAIAPLILWRVRRGRSAFVSDQALESLNFNVTVVIAALVCYLLTRVLIGILLFVLVALYWLAMTVIAAVRAGEGIRYRHPLTLRLIERA